MSAKERLQTTLFPLSIATSCSLVLFGWCGTKFSFSPKLYWFNRTNFYNTWSKKWNSHQKTFWWWLHIFNYRRWNRGGGHQGHMSSPWYPLVPPFKLSEYISDVTFFLNLDDYFVYSSMAISPCRLVFNLTQCWKVCKMVCTAHTIYFSFTAAKHL